MYRSKNGGIYGWSGKVTSARATAGGLLARNSNTVASISAKEEPGEGHTTAAVIPPNNNNAMSLLQVLAGEEWKALRLLCAL